MKCKGHIHTTVDDEDKVIPCEAELRNVGFKRGDNGEIKTENYICDNPECSRHRKIHAEELKGV